ncbi:MAG: hypothetical protein HUU01_12550 [Saprospiraceae bacterium]|nr:hypothetical protein [Saprospiraceae bacterium]
MIDPLLNFETYAATLQNVMAAAVEAAEALRDAAAADLNAAADYKIEKQEFLNQLENKARRKAEDDLAAQYPKMKAEMAAALLEKLKAAGKTPEEMALLEEALS